MEDAAPRGHSQSRIPLPASRLPRPATLRPSPSIDALRPTPGNLTLPRVRPAPSREQLTPRRIPSGPLLRQKENPAGNLGLSTLKGHAPRVASNDEEEFRKPLSPASSYRPNEQQSMSILGFHHAPLAPNELDSNATEQPTRPRQKQPSLSERAMETLQQIPSSPAVSRRRSSFYNPEGPMRSPSRSSNSSRPGSGYQQDVSMRPPSRTTSSRPGSSMGSRSEMPSLDFRASTNATRVLQPPTNVRTPLKRPVASAALRTPKSATNLRSSVMSTKTVSMQDGQDSYRSPSVKASNFSAVKSGSKTLTARSVKPRASLGGLFRASEESERTKSFETKLSPTFSSTSSDAFSTTSRTSKESATSVDSANEELQSTRKSSLALREQIAKARAAKRATTSRQASASSMSERPNDTAIVPAGTFDFGLSDDPFNLGASRDASKGLLRKRIDAARTDGRLNISALGLRELPTEVMNMYNLEALHGAASSWAESVDLTRFVAADNELEVLGDDVFPDVDPRDFLDDEDSKGNQFGGLETLDLHGNILRALPMGLRRLEQLTTLNLSNNKLENDCFDVISQVTSLRDLKLANNSLCGELDPRIHSLSNLEILDVQRNSLESLPESMADLFNLRILNVASNKIIRLPFNVLQALPITEIIASKNNLSGTLISLEDVELPRLQTLDVSVNFLTELASGTLRLPTLHHLSCSANRLARLPDLSTWMSLFTLTADDNCIAEFPEGFASLGKLKNVDLSGNNINIIDDKIGNMESLDILRISGNPLREKKFSGMSTEDLKRALKARCAPEEAEEVVTQQDDLSDGEFHSVSSSPGRSGKSNADWPVKAGGVLDRSHTQSYSLNPVIAANVAANHAVRCLELHHNLFQEIPSSIAFFANSLTTLNLAHNELTSDTFLKDELDLPALKELNVSSNTFNSLQPLVRRLAAPSLEKLDISFNRLTSLPPLRLTFPRLTVVLASNNTIKELSPDAVQGLRVLDCSSNDLNALNARIGLLGGPGGLERLEVGGNRFRVPKYTILEKGTEATLAWLRDRIPAAEVASPSDVE